MKAVIQRVAWASVTVAGRKIAAIDRGLLVLLGVADGDSCDDADYLAAKTCELRVFEDAAGKMNLALADVGGSILAVSQFTLLGDCRKGRRPGFSHAARPDAALELFNRFVDRVRDRDIPVTTGQFGAAMHVELLNDGPVTLIVESSRGGNRDEA